MEYYILSNLNLEPEDASFLDIINEGIQLSVGLKNLDFKPSDIYHKEQKTNLTEKSIRSSKTSKFNYETSKNMFSCVNKLIEFINNKCNTLFSLVTNDIDIIKYNNNDFFKRHNDFVPFKSKYITYYTLLFCLDANCHGGETAVYINDEQYIFSDTITKNRWILFKNEIDHESLPIKSGQKIVLKANVVHINLCEPEYNFAFDQLLEIRNEIIRDFKSAKYNILPLYNLSDYIFYRKCFENNNNIIPFQIIFNNSEICSDQFDIISTNSKEPIEQIYLKNEDGDGKNNHLIWFNIGNNFPIIRFIPKLTGNANCGDNDKTIVESDTSENSVDSSKLIREEIHETLEQTIYRKTNNLYLSTKINEIERIFCLMIYYFWYHTLGFSEENRIMDTDPQNIKKLVIKKIKENINKIQSKEYEVFKLKKLNYKLDAEVIKKIFNEKLIKKIFNSFKAETINYKVGGQYYCNENNYLEYRADLYFGFINLE